MPLESASYVNQLNSANPAPTDLLAQGDDHIRLIKAVLKATFPNITGPVTVSQTDLNAIAASISSAGVPVGTITAWYGSSASIPSGWHLCDGNAAVARSSGVGTIAVPDLRDKIILGAGSVAQGATAGASTATATTGAAGSHAHSTVAGQGGHTHTGVTVAGHALTISEMPAHTHTVPFNDSGTSGTIIADAAGTAVSSQVTSSTGGGAAHTHDMAWPSTPDGTHTHSTDTAAAHTHTVTVSTLQPSLALHYIMKV